MLNIFSQQFLFNSYSIPLVLVSTVIFCIGLFVFVQHRTSANNISFFFICLCVNFWLYGMSFVYAAQNPQVSLFIYRAVTFLGVSFVSPGVYVFSVLWLGLYGRQKRFVKIALSGAAFFYVVGLFSRYSFPGVRHYFWGYYPQYGPLNVAFLFFFFSFFIAAFLNFIRAYLSESDQIRKTQIKLIAIAFLISFMGSGDYIPKLFNVSVYPFGFICVLCWILLVAYTIVKYKVMDIETVIHKTILWMITSSAIIVPVAVFFYVYERYVKTNWFASIATACFLFLVFGFYLKRIQPKIDHFFKRRELDLQQTLFRFNDNLVHLKDLNELSRYLVNTIRETLYVDQVDVFLRTGRSPELHQINSSSQKKAAIEREDSFIRWLGEKDTLVVGEYLDLDPKYHWIRDKAKAFFQGLGIKICVPLVLDRELIGLIALGRKTNLKSFRYSEVVFLSELRRAVTLAVSNSLRLIEMQENLRRWNEELEEKVKQMTRELAEMQGQLIQAEKLATIGTLAGGVAHEINNPLTAVLTNAQILKMTAGKDDLESVSLIEEGAKRCQAIIQKLMKYARKSPGVESLERVDINKVIKNAVALLEYQLKQENIELVSEESASQATVLGNSVELEQVVTNLILNAKDAVQLANRQGRIEVKTSVENGTVGFLVKDNGCGISKEHLSKIFDPFFTTKDIGKGTGLGLAITYGIVKKYNGKIDVSSQAGTGTVFTVTFPSVQ